MLFVFMRQWSNVEAETVQTLRMGELGYEVNISISYTIKTFCWKRKKFIGWHVHLVGVLLDEKELSAALMFKISERNKLHEWVRMQAEQKYINQNTYATRRACELTIMSHKTSEASCNKDFLKSPIIYATEYGSVDLSCKGLNNLFANSLYSTTKGCLCPRCNSESSKCKYSDISGPQLPNAVCYTKHCV